MVDLLQDDEPMPRLPCVLEARLHVDEVGVHTHTDDSVAVTGDVDVLPTEEAPLKGALLVVSHGYTLL
jgi:hypothetical protein